MTAVEALFPSPHLPTPAAPASTVQNTPLHHSTQNGTPYRRNLRRAGRSVSCEHAYGRARTPVRCTSDWAPRVLTVAEIHPGGARERGGANVRGIKRRIAETYTPATRQPRAGRCAACEIAARGAMYVYRPPSTYVRTPTRRVWTCATRLQTTGLRARRYVAHRTHFEAPFLNWASPEDPKHDPVRDRSCSPMR